MQIKTIWRPSWTCWKHSSVMLRFMNFSPNVQREGRAAPINMFHLHFLENSGRPSTHLYAVPFAYLWAPSIRICRRSVRTSVEGQSHSNDAVFVRRTVWQLHSAYANWMRWYWWWSMCRHYLYSIAATTMTPSTMTMTSTALSSSPSL